MDGLKSYVSQSRIGCYGDWRRHSSLLPDIDLGLTPVSDWSHCLHLSHITWLFRCVSDQHGLLKDWFVWIAITDCEVPLPNACVCLFIITQCLPLTWELLMTRPVLQGIVMYPSYLINMRPCCAAGFSMPQTLLPVWRKQAHGFRMLIRLLTGAGTAAFALHR